MPRKQGSHKKKNPHGGGPHDKRPSAEEVAKKEEEENKDPDAHPYAIGATLLVRWIPDSSARLCTIIERAPARSAARQQEQQLAMLSNKKQLKVDLEALAREDEAWRYYVHYLDFNRRMDEWVTADRVLESPTSAKELAKVRATEDEARKAAADKAPDDEEQTKEDGGGVELCAGGMEGCDDAGEGAAAGPSGGSGALSTNMFRRKRKRASGALEGANAAVTAVDDMEHDEHEGLDEASLREHEEVTKVKNVGVVELGRSSMETWYFSPYPKEYYPGGYVDVLYVCEHTFSFFRSKRELIRHSSRQNRKSPPGNEIYRYESLAMFEVDGADFTEYCQNLCYFAKLFLDHKTLYFDVDPFLFYVLCELDDYGYHPVGYYSKEKYSEVGYNLACILTFPPYQRKGYGRFLISFSYELSRKESKVGAPEKPLSDLGHISYRAYWASMLVRTLRQQPRDASAISIMELSKLTSIMADDVIATLQYLGLIRCVAGTYILWCPSDVLDGLAKKYPPKTPAVHVPSIHFTPFLTDVKRDKFSIRSKRPTPEGDAALTSPT